MIFYISNTLIHFTLYKMNKIMGLKNIINIKFSKCNIRNFVEHFLCLTKIMFV